MIWNVVVRTFQTLILKSLFQGLDHPPLFPGFDEVIDNSENYFENNTWQYLKKNVSKNLGRWGSGCKWVGEAHSGHRAVLCLEESEN